MNSRTPGTGSCSASSGSQIRAANRVPSDSGIQVLKISRTGRGKLVTTFMRTLLVGWSVEGWCPTRLNGATRPHVSRARGRSADVERYAPARTVRVHREVPVPSCRSGFEPVVA